MVNTAEAVRSLFIPADGVNLVLPNAAVAEIIPYHAPERADNAPAWQLGRINWRDQNIPVISFEAASGHEAPEQAGRRARYAILNAITGDKTLRFYAIQTRDIPHLLNLKADGILPDDSHRKPRGAVLSHVTIGGQAAVIPDLDVLEDLAKRAV
jgi:chemosensory pili system protein ChpC